MSGREDQPSPEAEGFGGRHFRAMILRAGWMPPASGDARSHHTLGEGLEALALAKRHRGKAERIFSATFRQAWEIAPMNDRLDEVASGRLVEQLEESRFEAWNNARVAIGQILQPVHGRVWQDKFWLLDQWHRLKEELGFAREKAVEAFYWLDDLALDLGDTLVQVSEREILGPASSLAADAHREIHLSGDLFSGLLLCRLVFEESRWWQSCPVHTVHLRQGVSPGFTTQFKCSVCGGDSTECEHVAGARYEVHVGEPVDGNCAVCAEGNCGHDVGDIVTVEAVSTPVFGAVHEVSLVPRPRDPLARMDRMEVPAPEVDQVLKDNPRLTPHHMQCMCFCRGMQSWDKNDAFAA